MAWTAPRSAQPQEVLTAADWNTYVRDNLLETAPAKNEFGAKGRHFITTGLHSIALQDDGFEARVNTAATVTTTGAFGHPATGTVGPAVSIDTGVRALVMWSAQITSTTAGNIAQCSVRVTNATSITADEDWMLQHTVSRANDVVEVWQAHVFDLTAGTNGFTLLYNVGGGGGTTSYTNRSITVIPF